MQIKIRNPRLTNLVLTIILTIIILLILIIIVVLVVVYLVVSRTITNLVDVVGVECSTTTILYRGILVYPSDLKKKKESGNIYNRDLATVLWDICDAVGSLGCRGSIPIPPPFEQQSIMHMENIPGSSNLVSSNSVLGCIFYSPTLHTALFVFGGTYTKAQWRNNLQISFSRASDLNGSVSDTLVHSGFYLSYLTVRSYLWRWWASNGNNVKNLIITGRSLGGALATLCAFDFSETAAEILHYTYASPRVGNATFAQGFNDRVPYSVRIYNTEDVVTNIPPAIFRDYVYTHVGDARDSKPFTVNNKSLINNHLQAYKNLPI